MSWRQWTFWACCVEQFVLFCGDPCLNMMMSLPFQARLSSLWLQDKNCLTESVPHRLKFSLYGDVIMWLCYDPQHTCVSGTCDCDAMFMKISRCSNICPADVEALRFTSSAPEWDHHLFMELCTRLLSRWRNTKCEQHVVQRIRFMGYTLYWWRKVCARTEILHLINTFMIYYLSAHLI